MPSKSTSKKKSKAKFDRGQELELIRELVTRIVAECPKRAPTSEDERRAHEIMRTEFEALGLAVTEHAFKFNKSLYANLALHMGLGVAGTAVSGLLPWLGFLLHAGTAASYWTEATRKGYWLRRLFPWRPSRNVLATLPASDPSASEPALRVVVAAHVDAAYTGLLFNPDVIRALEQGPPSMDFTKRGLNVAVRSQVALAGIDLLRMFLGPLTWPLRPVEAILTLPSLVAFLSAIDVVLRNRIVPGANDDLSGVAALLVLARRLLVQRDPRVEYVFVATGCEEASLGGADALARDMAGPWDKHRTVVLGLDGLAGGDLRFVETEGEITRAHIPAWLKQVCQETTASEARFEEVTGYAIPVGGSDMEAFLFHGWEAVALVCVDPTIGAPHHYHQPSDTPENLDVDKVLFSTDYAHKLIESIITQRLGTAGA
ncbi:MAG: M28 family peptidase [Deltaproteobacteria bacterium]|nr:M28 family peptidase [Deltaproteobacteria bacterium]